MRCNYAWVIYTHVWNTVFLMLEIWQDVIVNLPHNFHQHILHHLDKVFHLPLYPSLQDVSLVGYTSVCRGHSHQWMAPYPLQMLYIAHFWSQHCCLDISESIWDHTELTYINLLWLLYHLGCPLLHVILYSNQYYCDAFVWRLKPCISI